MYLPNPDAPGFQGAPRIVASIDRTTLAATDQWLITWAGRQTNATAGAALDPFYLRPEWLAQPLLRWIHETAGASNAAVDLAGFAGEDVPLGSVVTLAGHLASNGLVIVDSFDESATATLTAQGLATAEKADAARADPRLRAQALRQGMITWLADRENGAAAPPDWRPFLYDPRSSFHGDLFSNDELVREAQYLAEHGLIRGLADQHDTNLGWTCPRLTAKGRDCNDDYGGNVAESLKPEPPTRATHINVATSPGTQINVGDHNQQQAPPTPAPSPVPEVGPLPEPTGSWRTAWNFLNSVAGVVTMIVSVGILIVAYLQLWH